MWLEVVVVVVIAVVSVRVVYRRRAGRCLSPARLHGKTVIVTGSSAGIGKAAALDFAKRGARVILACRNLDKAGKVADEIIECSGNSSVEVRQLDTSDLSSVRHFAAGILKSEEYLHILVNNAGIIGPRQKKLTEDGLELTMATNHYGHFLLTNLLLGLLKRSAPSRIINVSSLAHKFCYKLDPEDLNFEKSSYMMGYSTYGQSKLCNVLFTLELSNKLKGTGVTANCLCPGSVATEIFHKTAGILFYIAHLLFLLMAKEGTGEADDSVLPGWGDASRLQQVGRSQVVTFRDPELGAQTIVHLAVADEVDGISGKYFVDCKEEKFSGLGGHRGMAKKLWLASELDVKLLEEETHY
ncbi:Retinol dehydrogenase 13 [Chionoecetes opilio]|uniref:Retinol dehydrogenase 13 n=1 Tax=Chionoecetes opilio TaxID=41210 RepID=A0A8J4YBA4_CHIOP|nr:Retinol dehydrogenase 13 [Chionoecetes opilio]